VSSMEYLQKGLIDGGKLRDDLMPHVRTLAASWIETGVDVGVVDILAEHLARWAVELEAPVGFEQIAAGTAYLDLAPDVTELLREAVGQQASATELAALAVHLVDIAEAMALVIFVPELPALSAKADRTGDAARMVGVARHLKG